MTGAVRFRPAELSDTPALGDLYADAAVPGRLARRDEALRSGAVWLSLLAERDGRLEAEALFVHVGVLGRLGALGLESLVARPEERGGRLALSLAAYGIEVARKASVPLIFSRAEPEFFGALGFTAEAAAGFTCEPEVRDLRALRLHYGPPISGKLLFPAGLA